MNHMRSPFFPPYPETFDSEDEKEAQKRRLQGETVPLPDAADPAFGKVLRKALAPESERFARAEDFRRELLKVIKATYRRKKEQFCYGNQKWERDSKKTVVEKKKNQKSGKGIVIFKHSMSAFGRRCTAVRAATRLDTEMQSLGTGNNFSV